LQIARHYRNTVQFEIIIEKGRARLGTHTHL